MESQFRICRVCTENEGGGELVPIFEKNNKIALGIFVICGVKILELGRIPALICLSCVKELSKTMKFRKKCRETDDFIKKSCFEMESIIWNGAQDVASGSRSNDCLQVKQETVSDRQKIKDEPFDDFNIDLFENIDTILEENLEGSQESNSLAGVLKKAKKEESYSESSDSETEYEVVRKKRRSRSSMKRSVEFRDFDLW